MDIILKNAPNDQLAAAIEMNLLAYFYFHGRSPKAEFSEVDGIQRWKTSVAHPWFNGVSSARPPRGDERILIQDTVAYFQARGVAAFTWWLQPDQRGVGWEEQFARLGLKTANDPPGMAADLEQLSSPAPPPPGLRILPVTDMAALAAWCSTFSRGYGVPPEMETAFRELISDLGFGLPFRYYTGYLDGQAVCAGTLFLAAGVAGIYNVATLPEARGRGFGAAVTRAVLEDALALGYRYAILQSSEMGFSVYQRLGFRKLLDITHFYWEG